MPRRYYGVPSISMRNALHQLVLQGMPGFRIEELWVDDAIHPTEAGHAFLAYVVLDYLSLISAQLRYFPHDSIEDVREAATEERMPVPLATLYRNNPSRKGACMQGEGLSKQVVTMSGDWQWEKGEKAGYITAVPGAEITLFIPETATEPEMSGGTVGDATRTGHIGVQRSWKDYGKAAVTCQGNCTCAPFVLDLHTSDSKITVQELYDFSLQRSPVESNESCEVTVTVLNDTSSGGHLVKVMSLGAEQSRRRRASYL